MLKWFRGNRAKQLRARRKKKRRPSRLRARIEFLEPRLPLAAFASHYDAVSPEWFAEADTESASPGITLGTDTLSFSGALVDHRWIVRLTPEAVDDIVSVGESVRLLENDAGVNFKFVRGLGLAGQVLVEVSGVAAERAERVLREKADVLAYYDRDWFVASKAKFAAAVPEVAGGDYTATAGSVKNFDVAMPQAWDRHAAEAVPVVAVIDSGIDITHPDLAANIWTNPGEIPNNRLDDDGNGFVDDVNGFDFINDSGDPSDEHGHGTHVAGVISAIGNEQEGITGVNWSTSLMTLKALSRDSQGATADVVRAINYVTMMRTQYGVNVRAVNNSWGSSHYSEALRDSIKAAGDADILFVAAAGNGSVGGAGSNTDATPFFPASYNLDNIISVAAVNQDGQLANFSNFGRQSVDIAAPGVGVRSTALGHGYAVHNGTSMAAPHVAGVAAIVWSEVPNATAYEVKAALMRSADPLPSSADHRRIGGGMLNATAVLSGDVLAPRILKVSAPDIVSPAAPISTINVLFSENISLDVFTLDSADLRINRNGEPLFDFGVQLVERTAGANANSVEAVYHITPPGGAWTWEDNGIYEVILEAGQVLDTSGNAAASAVIGSFKVELPKPLVVNTADDAVDVTPGDGLAADASGNRTLRAAIMEANALPDAATIVLPAGHYRLSLPGADEDAGVTGDLDITGDLTIVGAGRDKTIIDGSQLDRVFHVAKRAKLTLRDLTLTGGRAEAGGGIYSNGGTIEISNSSLTGNASGGEGRRVESGTVVDVPRSAGGALYVRNSTVSISTSTFSGNNAAHSGGAIWSGEGSRVSIEQSRFVGNSAQEGGALSNSAKTYVTIRNTELSNNSADVGGSILNSGTLEIVNSTISGNLAASRGGGIVNTGDAKLLNTTVSDNRSTRGAGGVEGTGTVVLRNTIIAGNTSGEQTADVGGDFKSDGHNLIGDVGGAKGLADGVNGDQVGSANAPLDPLLAPLKDNGGASRTHSLLPGSPAIDAGVGVGTGTDQRGAPRQLDGDRNDTAVADIGAFELYWPVAIEGQVFAGDASDETGLSSVTVFADRNGNQVRDEGEPSTVTMEDDPTTPQDEAGMFYFRDLPPGEYTVQVEDQKAWEYNAAEASQRRVEARPGEVHGVRFGLRPRSAEIHGIVFEDMNGDGKRDVDEPSLSKVTVFIDSNGDGFRDPAEPATQTDEFGRYAFESLEPNRTYAVRREAPRPSHLHFQVSMAAADLDQDGTDDVMIAPIDAFHVINFLATDASTSFDFPALMNGQTVHRVEAQPGETAAHVDFAMHESVDWQERSAAGAGSARPLELTSTITDADTAGSQATISDDNTAPAYDPQRLVVGDLDHDGRMDAVALSKLGDQLFIYYNDGFGSFSESTTIELSNLAASIEVGDLDGDSDVDIVVASLDRDNLSVFWNLGGQQFSPAVSYAAGSDPWSLALEDIDGNGLVDVAVGNYSAGTVTVLLNQGGGLLTSAGVYQVGNAPAAVSLADIDNDGYADLAVANSESDSVTVLRNDGTGVFGSRVDYPVGELPYLIAVADFDSDGDVDLAIANAAENDVSILLNDGSGKFQGGEDIPLDAPARGLVAADFDGDGDVDLVAATNDLVLLLNDGEGNFSEQARHRVDGNAPISLATADVNADGSVDLLVVTRDHSGPLVLTNQFLRGELVDLTRAVDQQTRAGDATATNFVFDPGREKIIPVEPVVVTTARPETPHSLPARRVAAQASPAARDEANGKSASERDGSVAYQVREENPADAKAEEAETVIVVLAAPTPERHDGNARRQIELLAGLASVGMAVPAAGGLRKRKTDEAEDTADSASLQSMFFVTAASDLPLLPLLSESPAVTVRWFADPPTIAAAGDRDLDPQTDRNAEGEASEDLDEQARLALASMSAVVAVRLTRRRQRVGRLILNCLRRLLDPQSIRSVTVRGMPADAIIEMAAGSFDGLPERITTVDGVPDSSRTVRVDTQQPTLTAGQFAELTVRVPHDMQDEVDLYLDVEYSMSWKRAIGLAASILELENQAAEPNEDIDVPGEFVEPLPPAHLQRIFDRARIARANDSFRHLVAMASASQLASEPNVLTGEGPDEPPEPLDERQLERIWAAVKHRQPGS